MGWLKLKDPEGYTLLIRSEEIAALLTFTYAYQNNETKEMTEITLQSGAQFHTPTNIKEVHRMIAIMNKEQR